MSEKKEYGVINEIAYLGNEFIPMSDEDQKKLKKQKGDKEE